MELGSTLNPSKLSSSAAVFRTFKNLTNDCTLVEFHIKIDDNTATPKIKKKIALHCEKPIKLNMNENFLSCYHV